jgi:putative hydrolases of HD superfamily
MSPSLENIIRFTDLLNRYRAVERAILVKDSDRKENDTEHSFSLAMLAWYINSVYDLKLDTAKLFMYSLAHDLVEVYAGDTYFFSTDENIKSSKHKREEDAAIRIQNEFPEFKELHTAITSYEKKDDKESKFIYALDKIEPVLNIYVDKGRTWRKNKVTLKMLVDMKNPKVSIDPTIENIFNQLSDLLSKEHDRLFE